MALVFCDGFDHLGTWENDPILEYTASNQLWYKWEKGYLGSSPMIGHSPSWARRPAPSSWPIGYHFCNSVYYEGWILRHFNEAHYDTLIFGFAFLGYPGFNQPNSPLVTFFNYDGNVIIRAYGIDGNGRVMVAIAPGTTSSYASQWNIAEYYSAINTTQEMTWYHLDCKIVLHESDGSIVARINETEVINETGIQTYKAGGDSLGAYSYTQIELRKGLHNTYYMDDLYILDGEGTVANDLIGDVRVDTIYPNANGFYTNFTPEPGSNSNYQNVMPMTFDRYRYPDTPLLREFWYQGTGANFNNYNEAEDTVRECYELEPLLALDKPIYGLQTNSIFRKTDAGKKQVEQFVRISSNDYDSGRVIDVPDFSKNYYYPVSVNPFTSNAWTEAEIASLQSGIKIVT
jgi:hypothetical protein